MKKAQLRTMFNEWYGPLVVAAVLVSALMAG